LLNPTAITATATGTVVHAFTAAAAGGTHRALIGLSKFLDHVVTHRNQSVLDVVKALVRDTFDFSRSPADNEITCVPKGVELFECFSLGHCSNLLKVIR
jgi:hypothetical protein